MSTDWRNSPCSPTFVASKSRRRGLKKAQAVEAVSTATVPAAERIPKPWHLKNIWTKNQLSKALKEVIGGYRG
jgi:hypothetical protein